MKVLWYIALILVVVPLQTTLLQHVSLFDVRPDVGLVVACLVGFFGGELDGLVIGFILGWSQDLMSAGELWVNVVSKGGAGFLAGLAGRHLAHITPTVLLVGLALISCLSSLVFVYSMKTSDWEIMWHALHSKVVVQAFLDATIGAGAYWLFVRRWRTDRLIDESRL